MRIQIINGPNLNLLGVREPGIYGSSSFENYLTTLRARFPDITIDYYQNNCEGELINKIQEVGFTYDCPAEIYRYYGRRFSSTVSFHRYDV